MLSLFLASVTVITPSLVCLSSVTHLSDFSETQCGIIYPFKSHPLRPLLLENVRLLKGLQALAGAWPSGLGPFWIFTRRPSWRPGPSRTLPPSFACAPLYVPLPSVEWLGPWKILTKWLAMSFLLPQRWDKTMLGHCCYIFDALGKFWR